METQDYWHEYVGPESPLEFMGRYASDEPDRCVAKYMSRLPHLFGIVRRQSWTSTFAQEDQLRKEPVMAALTAHLEATREDWEPALEAYRRSRPQPPEGVEIQEIPQADGEADEVPDDYPDEDRSDDTHDAPHADHDAADDDHANSDAQDHAATETDTDVDMTRNVETAVDNLPEMPDPPPELPVEP